MAIRSELDRFLKDAEAGVLDVMQSNLSYMADSLINRIETKDKDLTSSNKLEAVKGLTASGTNFYKKELLETLTVIAYESLRLAKKEVPKAKYKLSEIDFESIQFVESKKAKKLKGKSVKGKKIETMFSKLPPSVKKRIKFQQELLVKTQLSDLEKAIYFQYSTSLAQEKSINQIKNDLKETAMDFIDGPSVRAGAPLTAHQAIGEARSAFFNDPEVDKLIEAYEFVNNYQINRTPLCENLNGQIFAKDDPNRFKFEPPLHWNCRSVHEPILIGDLKGRKIERLGVKAKNKTEKIKIEKYLQFSERNDNAESYEGEAWKHPINCC